MIVTVPGGFGALTNAWALMTRKKLLNSLTITLCSNCHSTAPPNGYKGSQDVILEIMDRYIFSYKMHFLIKFHIIALDEVDVEMLVL